jgi:hypothetical protein
MRRDTLPLRQRQYGPEIACARLRRVVVRPSRWPGVMFEHSVKGRYQSLSLIVSEPLFRPSYLPDWVELVIRRVGSPWGVGCGF